MISSVWATRDTHGYNRLRLRTDVGSGRGTVNQPRNSDASNRTLKTDFMGVRKVSES